jgi:hypothetical protein
MKNAFSVPLSSLFCFALVISNQHLHFAIAGHGALKKTSNSIANSFVRDGQLLPFYVQSKQEKGWCAGSLVAPDVVLTAAQCNGACQ